MTPLPPAGGPFEPRPVLERAGPARLPTPFATFDMTVFREAATGLEHAAITLGDVGAPLSMAPLVRLHSECLTGDALFSLRCDCGFQLRAALERIAAEGRGVLLYLRQEGRGIGLANKIRAYELQDGGADTVEANERLGLPADARRFDVAVAMLEALGVGGVRLMTNNPRKVAALDAAGIRAERVPLAVGANPHNQAYLATKAARLGHLLGAAVEGPPRTGDAAGTGS